jgi:hypothetical protein
LAGAVFSSARAVVAQARVAARKPAAAPKRILCMIVPILSLPR